MIRLTADQLYYLHRLLCLEAPHTTVLTCSQHALAADAIWLFWSQGKAGLCACVILRGRRGEAGQCQQLKWLVLLNERCRVYGVHRTCAETAAVSRGIGHETTKQRCQYTTSSDIKKTHYKEERKRKDAFTHSESHSTVSLLESR